MRVDDDQLNKALLGYGRQGVGSIALEEFVEGHEGTRVAAHDGLSPLFIGSGRAVGAAALAALCLFATRQAVPSTRQWARLAVVAGGVVVGFPLLTSYALTQAPATHGAVVIGLLPAATAVMAVLRGKEHVPVSFRAHAPQVHIEHLPVGGLNVWARLPDGTDVDQLVRECETQGLLVAPGTEWFPAEPSGPFIRLNFSGENPSRLAEAGEVLGNALRTVA
ncbi:MAG: EamA family transporter [Geodermatophilaceae bacterium]